MLRTLAALIPALIPIVLCSVAIAETPAGVMRSAIEQFRAGETLRTDIIISNDEDLRSASQIVRGTLTAKLDAEDGLTAYRYEARLSGDDVPRGARVTLISDGTTVQYLDYAGKMERRTSADEAESDPLVASTHKQLGWVLAFLAPGLSLDEITDHESLTLRDGREGRDECHILSGDVEEVLTQIYIAKSTDLPVRLDVNDGETSRVIRLNKLRLGVRVPDSAFTIRPAPRGFISDDPNDPMRGPGGKNARPSKNSDANVGVQEGDTAPDWTLADSKGKPHSLSDYRGEVVLMDFWATWCPPCRRAMPGLQKLHEEYASQGLNVIGVNAREENPDEAVGYMKSKRFDYQLLLRGDSVFDRFKCKSLPTFFLIDQEGTIIYRQSGFSPQVEDKLEEKIREALGLGEKEFDPDNMTPEEIEDYEDY